MGLFAVWPFPKAKDYDDGPAAAGTSQVLVAGQLDRTESPTCGISLVKRSLVIDCPIAVFHKAQKSGRPCLLTGISVNSSNERENKVVAPSEMTQFSTVARVTLKGTDWLSRKYTWKNSCIPRIKH